MFKQEIIKKILDNAALLDPKYKLFGSEKHLYKLNPPIDVKTVREVENLYNFTLPDDYFRFITEIGDGGAGPDYGIFNFTYFLNKGSTEYFENNKEIYRRSVARPFSPRPMKISEVENFSFSLQGYEKNPYDYFVFGEYNQEDDEFEASTDGFFVIGTHGCQWSFGIIVAGERRGQVFDTDNEGAYCFLANSFDEFYQRWLDSISLLRTM